MPSQIQKLKFSGSTNGRGIKVAATATAGTLIHTAIAGTTDGTYDEIWLYAVNFHTVAIELTIEMGGVTSPDDLIPMTIPPRGGKFLVLDGDLLQNATVVRAFAGSANLIMIRGHVHRITN